MQSSLEGSYHTSQDSDQSTASLTSEDMDNELLRPLPPRSISSILSEPRFTSSADTVPRGSRCLLTLETGPSLRVCRLIPDTTRPTSIRRLEHFWRIPPGTFDVNIPQNIMILRSDLNLAFNQLEWVLMPTKDVLVRIRDWQRANYTRIRVGSSPGYLEEFPNRDDWEYVFVAFRLHKRDVAISRLCLPDQRLEQTCFKAESDDIYNDGDRDRCGPSSCEDDAKGRIADLLDNEPPVQHSVFVPPYADFPRIKSHVHPFFVIYAAAEAFQCNRLVPVTPEHSELGNLAAWITSIWKHTSIPPASPTRNERPKPLASAIAPSSPQESNEKGHALPPDQPQHRNSLSLVEFEAHPQMIATPELGPPSLLASNGRLKPNLAAYTLQGDIHDPGVEKWVDEIVLRTSKGELELVEDSYSGVAPAHCIDGVAPAEKSWGDNNRDQYRPDNSGLSSAN